MADQLTGSQLSTLIMRQRMMMMDSTDTSEETGTESIRNTRGTVLFAKGIEDFTNDFYKSVADDLEENFVCSAFSAHVVMSIAAYGAKGKTAKEMKDALHLPKMNALSNFKHFLKAMNNVKNITLGIVIKILTDKNIIVKNDFRKIVKSFFYSEIEEVDFANNDKAIVKSVNSWCAKQTHDKIKEIMSPDSFDAKTKLILLNAVYFKACWGHKFLTCCTSLQPFHVDKKTIINVPTMHEKMQLHYKDLKVLDAECIALPYKNNDFLFVVIKPKKIDGLKNIERNLEKIDINYQENFGTYDHNMRFIALALPKFKADSTINLNINLQKLGMTTMFTDDANFKGVSSKPALIPPIQVDKVLQKVFIEVNEEGTEAAAVTYFGLRGGGPTLEYYDFKVNRPFLYRIVQKSTNVTLFSGRVVRPIPP